MGNASHLLPTSQLDLLFQKGWGQDLPDYEGLFASEYDALEESKGARTQDEVAFYTRVAESTPTFKCRNETRILEVGCGTGRLSFPLASQGFRVLGIERSKDMIKRFEMQAKRNGDEMCEVKSGDARALHEIAGLGSFDLVIFSLNFIYYLSADDLAASLRSAARLLAHGGRLCIDFGALVDPSAAVRSLATSDWKLLTCSKRKARLALFESSFDEASSRLRFLTCLTDMSKASGPLLRRTVSNYHMHRLQEVVAFLCDAGLQVKSLCGDYDGSVFRPQMPVEKCLVVAGA